MYPSAVLRYKPHRSMYIHIRLAIRFSRALHMSIFEQPEKMKKHKKVVMPSR